MQIRQSHRPLVPRDSFGSLNHHLSNSLVLSSEDRECLFFFPHTAVVAFVGKPWQWDMQSHLFSHVAYHSAVVMRLIIAISSSELQWRKERDHEVGCISDRATEHYVAALREFQTVLDEVGKQPPSRERQDEVMATFYFLIAYEQHFSADGSGLSAHLSGVQAFLERCGISTHNLSQLAEKLYSATSGSLLLIMIYMALNHAFPKDDSSLQYWPNNMKDDEFTASLDRLFQENCDVNAAVFNDDYPAEAFADDMSVHQALEFAQECSKLRPRFLSFIRNGIAGPSRNMEAQTSFEKLNLLGKVCECLIKIHSEPSYRLTRAYY
ncbi:hypothetical protein HJFPF1_12114 [Paramyrothecium foliicola]|nr:hypothetical protein HJFPF1_12114 [Paramyrothecium foliicola]